MVDAMMHRHEQTFPFAFLDETVAPDPSDLWGKETRKAPYPTNTGWLNFVLNNGTCAEYIHPYTIQSLQGKISICYPTREVQPAFIFQAFVPNLSISFLEEGSVSHAVSYFDDLSVTLKIGSRVSLPLVRGCPYVTFVVQGGTPVISTIHAVLNIRSNEEDTKHEVLMNNGQTWIVYCSSSLPLNLGSTITTSHPFTGVLRFALRPDDEGSEAILDRYSTCYPAGGHADLSVPFQIKYSWKHYGWGELLMLSLPYHRDILSELSVKLPSLSYASIDGPLEGVVGESWVLHETPITIGWYSSKGVKDDEAREQIASALHDDVDSLSPILSSSTYFQGKALARAARLGLIAEELGVPSLVGKVRDFLVDSITPWFDGSYAGNALLYDKKWGGIVSRDGARDVGADFGLAAYNDHHYHFGYFCYAGAVLAKFDPRWARTYKSHLYALVGDFMNLDSGDQYFTRLRCFDTWLLHSWAGGLTEFADGRNQESTSEAVNAYYAASLVGLAFADPQLINVGLTLTALEIRASKFLWHIPSCTTLYEREFARENRIMGVLWANKRDSGLWFAAASYRECRLGIQLLPITPASELLFDDMDFVRELVEWTVEVLHREGVTDGWRGFVYSLLAMYRPKEALRKILNLKEHDDGNSLSNLLWWIHTR